MTERIFRLFIGAFILTALCLEQRPLMIGLITVLLFEGFTNWRIPLLASRLRYGSDAPPAIEKACWPIHAFFKIDFDAERAWRFTVAIMLCITYLIFYEQAWFIPWFMGFAIFGAGLSGVCPMLLSLKLLGFR
jgi:hypothetical protein